MITVNKEGRKVLRIKKFKLNLRKLFEDDTEMVLGVVFGLCVLGILICCAIALLGGLN